MTQNNTLTEVEKVVEEFMSQFPCFDSQCDLHGAIPHQVSEDEWEAIQCQYCFQVRFPLRDRLCNTLTSLLTRLEEEKKKAVEGAVRKTLELFHEGANTEENFRHVLKAITSPTNK